jgi:nicotinamidase-related amidase
MEPKTTAVVLIEYQNDFTSEGGTLHQAVKPVMDSTNMLANTVETVEKARALGATILFAPITFTEDYHDLSPAPYGILKGVVDSKSFRKGTWVPRSSTCSSLGPRTSPSKASAGYADSPALISISFSAAAGSRISPWVGS